MGKKTLKERKVEEDRRMTSVEEATGGWEMEERKEPNADHLKPSREEETTKKKKPTTAKPANRNQKEREREKRAKQEL